MIVCPICASSHDVTQALLSVVIVRDRAHHPIPRFTRIFHSTSHSFELLLMSRLIHLRLQTQLMWQGFVCIVASAARLLSSAARLFGAAARWLGSAPRRGAAAPRHGSEAARRVARLGGTAARRGSAARRLDAAVWRGGKAALRLGSAVQLGPAARRLVAQSRRRRACLDGGGRVGCAVGGTRRRSRAGASQGAVGIASSSRVVFAPLAPRAVKRVPFSCCHAPAPLRDDAQGHPARVAVRRAQHARGVGRCARSPRIRGPPVSPARCPVGRLLPPRSALSLVRRLGARWQRGGAGFRWV